jgi:hypothetical protein
MEMYDLNSGGGGGTPLTYNPSVPDNGAGTGLNVPKPGKKYRERHWIRGTTDCFGAKK